MAILPIDGIWTGARPGLVPTSIVPYSQLQSFFSFQGTTDPTTSTVPPTTVGDSVGIFYFNTVGNTFWYLKSINAGVYTWVNLTQGGGSSSFIIATTDPTSATVGTVGQGIYNTLNNIIWICIAVNTGSPTTYTWKSPSNTSSGSTVGRTNVVFNASTQISPIKYIVSPQTIDNRIIVNMPLLSSSNLYSTNTGDGLINNVRYIRSNNTLQTYGSSISFPTSLNAGQYLANLNVTSPTFAIRVNSSITIAATDIDLRVGIGNTQAITDTENPLDDGYVWEVFDKAPFNPDNFIPQVVKPSIVVTPVSGQSGQYDINISGGQWIGSSYSSARTFTGSADEYCIFIGIVALNAAIFTSIVSITNFSGGSAVIDINLNGVAGGGGGGGDLTGNCVVIGDVDPGSSVFPIGSPYISTDNAKIIGIPIPLNALTNDYTYFAGSGFIGTTRYIQSSDQRTVYGTSMIFPTSLIVEKYNAYVSLKDINCTVRVTCVINPGTNWTTEFSICPKTVATSTLSPIGDGRAWSPFELPPGNDNDSLLLTAPTITVTPVAGETNKYDVNISGGEWYMGSLSETNGYIGSTTEYLAYFSIYNNVAAAVITAVENPTTYNSFSDGFISIEINLNGIGGGGGSTYTFDPAFFTNTNNTISLLDGGITNAKINTVDFSKITNVPYGTPQGLPRLDTSSLVQLVNLPSASATNKGVSQVDGTTITASLSSVISVSQDGIKPIIYNLMNQILLVSGNITKTTDDVNKQITLTGNGSGPTPTAFDYSLTATWADGTTSKPFYTSEASISYSAVATVGSITGTISVVGVQNGSNIFTAATATGTQAITDFIDAITINASIQGTGTQGAGQITVNKSTQLSVFSPIFYFCGAQPTNVQSMVSLGIAPQASNTFQVASGTVGGIIYFATTGTVTSIVQQGFSVTFTQVGTISYTPGNVTYKLWQMTGAGTTYQSPFTITLNIQ